MYCCRFLTFSSLLALLSCSVLEDRESCPEAVVIDWSEVKADFPDGYVCWGIEGYGADTLAVLDLPEQSFVDIPVGENAFLYVFYEEDDIPLSSVPPGSEFREVYSYFSPGPLHGTDTVTLSRNHAKLIVRMDDIYESSLTYEILGKYVGYGTRGELEEGVFRCPLAPLSGTVANVVVPRQGDSSLRLVVYSSGEMVRNFPIGKYIEESGYDWTETWLKDIFLEVRIVSSSVTFKVGLWSKTVNIALSI